MKNFLTSMLGSLVALVIFAAVCLVVFVGLLATLAAIGARRDHPAELARGSYLVYDLGTQIADAPAPVDFGPFNRERGTLQLRTITRAIRAAAHDPRIAGIYLGGDLSEASFGPGYADLREVRDALESFRAAGKPVVAYLTFATTKTYYLASAATDLEMDPYGVIFMPGLASEPIFFAGAFQKYGVNVQVTRVGKYKAAVEPFIRSDMSPENRLEVQRLLDDIWNGLLSEIAPSRDLTPAKIQADVDRQGLIRADLAKADRLVDRVAYRDQVFEALKAKTGRAGTNLPFKQIALADYAGMVKDIAVPASAAGDFGGNTGAGRIAVVYAEGDIVDGEGGSDEVGGTRFSRELRRLRLDDGVKAVVLRVDSPGGSAAASEVIQREIRLLKRTKPVVVSMGNYAASGGYWISTYGDRIFAEPTTITGSIGVFGIQFDIQKLANDHGITFDSVKTGRFADALTITRPKTPEELAILQGTVDWIYGQFVGKVADARNLPRARVEEIAQGRVWSGMEARKLGLVDRIGGLDAAIAYAARQAKLGRNFRLVEFPRKKQFIEVLQEFLSERRPSRADGSSLAAKVSGQLARLLGTLHAFNDPRGVYARLPIDITVR